MEAEKGRLFYQYVAKTHNPEENFQLKENKWISKHIKLPILYCV